MQPSFVRRFSVGIVLVGLLASLFSQISTTHAQGSVIYVVPGGLGSQDGSSWANAKDLQAALRGAASGSQLWVKAGAYTPTTGYNDFESFRLRSGVAVYGGFTGTETQLSQRNVAANVTTLSGEIGAAGNGDNSWSVVTATWADATSILDGFTISGGNSTNIPGSLGTNGGGILNDGGSPQLTNLIITGNLAGLSGGGMYNGSGSPVLTNVTISGNRAGRDGGGIYNSAGSPVLTNVTISGNGANYGGGVYNYNNMTLRNATISGNSATRDGGGVYNGGGSLALTNATISGNSATEDGGGMYSPGSSPVLTNVTISGNRAGDDGGGMYNGGGSPVLTNVTISGNSVPARGSGMFNYDSYPVLRNSIVWANPSDRNIFLDIYNLGGSAPDVQYSLIDGGHAGIGNLNTDPRFVTAVPTAPSTGGDLHLQDASPAINAGDTSRVPSGVTTDRDGNPRIVGSVVDMGAYEDQRQCGNRTRLFVTSSAQGSGNGDGWANSAGGLQVALARAQVCVGVTEVWVAQGTYTPTPGTDRTATFALKNGLAIYGGFAGTETALSERNMAGNVTRLSGEIGAAGNSDNSHHVVTGNGVDATASLDGLTISDGNTGDQGGGLYNTNSSPTLTNITISGNTAMYGGGLYNTNSSPRLRNVVISGNRASFVGGAIYNNASSNPTLTNITMSGNSAGIGGGLFNNASGPTVQNSILWGNSGAQITDANGSSPTVRTSIVQGGYGAGTGILDIDPRFVTAVPTAPSTGGDLHLQAGSPAINAGSNTAIPVGVTTDRDNLPRVVANTVDLGAFERQAVQTITFAPVTAKTYGDPPFQLSATASSGLPITFAASGVCTVAGNTVTLTGVGTCTMSATQAGDATHDPVQAGLTIPVARGATTTTLQSSANPSALGQEVTFTAKVTASGGTPTGTVTFKDGATVLGTGTLSNGTATFATTTLSVGTHTIVAVYGGSATHTSSARSLSQLVRHVSTTTLTSSLNPSRYGQSVTFTAQVSGSAGVPSGTVTFLDGATVLRSFTLSGGQATLVLSTLSVGSHSITARYNGNAVYASGTSPILTQSVAKAVTTTTLSSSANPSALGQAVTFTAKVTATSGGTPSGTVTFKDGADILGTATLSSGTATFETTPIGLDPHSIVAAYGGSATHASSARSLNQVVRYASTTALASSLNPSGFGQLVTFTAQVSGRGGEPSGTVTFLDGATLLRSVTLSGEQATLTLSTLSVGNHSITARYNGNARYLASTSPVLTQSVAKAVTTTTLQSSPNPSTLGQAVTFTAKVTAASGGIPSGTVTFKDGATILGTATLSSGTATFATTTLSVGTHTIYAVYGGSTTHLGSQDSLRQVVR